MTALNNYLAEKNISVKDFAKITKVKEKKLNRVLDKLDCNIIDDMEQER